MPKYLPLSTIRSMSYPELERWWETDFDVLTSTAVAEATGSVMPSVAEALRSDDWIEQWADALYAASGELASSTERMDYTNDKRLPATRKKAGHVVQRMGQANALLRTRSHNQGWAMLADHMKTSRGASISILARQHKEEARQLAEAEIARRCLAPHHPLWEQSYETKFDAIEDAARRGLIQVSATPAVRVLLGMTAQELSARVAADVTQQEDRCVELRHPLLLRSWSTALERLRDEHCKLNGMPPAFTVTMPSLDMQKLRAMNSGDAWSIINRRRFIRALAQRNRECQMHIRELTRVVGVRQEEIKEPWRAAVAAAYEELASRHPKQMEALLAAFVPFCVPGSTEIRREFLGTHGQVPTKLIPALKRSMADGTWQRLLDEPAI